MDLKVRTMGSEELERIRDIDRSEVIRTG